MTHPVVRRRALRILRGQPVNTRPTAVFGALTRQYIYATFAVRVFYIMTFWVTFDTMTRQWATWRDTDLVLLWPVAWVQSVPSGIDMIAVFALVATGLAMIAPERRTARFMAFVGFLFVAALVSSFGKVNHNFHGWVGFTFALIFIPCGGWSGGDRLFRQRLLLAVWSGMALVGLFYSMSGFLKIVGLAEQMAAGGVHALHPQGLMYQILGRVIQTGTAPLFGELVIAYPRVGWPLYPFAIYIELFALLAVFRPRLHRLWGLGLIGLHVGNWLLMGIVFNINVLLLGLFFVLSPFAADRLEWQVWRDLPLVGAARRLLASIIEIPQRHRRVVRPS